MKTSRYSDSQLLVISFFLLGSVFGAFFMLDLGHYLNLDYLKTQRQALEQYYSMNPGLTLALYFCLYVLVAALSLPGAALLTLAGGALFGLLTGAVVVSFASTLGATLAFLIARYVLRDTIQNRFSEVLGRVNAGIEQDGALYLFTLRLVPVVPFFVINLVMGLTTIRTQTFYWVSQLGMLAGTLVYVNAGTQLAQVDSLAGVLSPVLVASFVLLGCFPWGVRQLVALMKAR